MAVNVLKFAPPAAINDNVMHANGAPAGAVVPPMLRTLLAAAAPGTEAEIVLRIDALAQEANLRALAATRGAAQTGFAAAGSRALAEAMKVLAFQTGEVAAQVDAAVVGLRDD
jgi:hypothetical protein